MENLFRQKNEFPKIMGILNVTPDSFSDGGNYLSISKATDYAMEMLNLGVDIIDIGGESTRAGAPKVSEQEEIDRTLPLIENIRKENSNILISIDTTKYKVGEYSLKAGANIINDISGLTQTPELAQLSAIYNAWLVIMHIKGTPQNMQVNPIYEDVVQEVFDFFVNQIKLANVNQQNKIILDVGIGFGKTYNHNIELLKSLNKFESLNYPKLLGISRKSFIGKMLNIENPKERDIATFFIHSILLYKNIDIIRIHNVVLAIQLKKIYEVFN